MASLIPVEAANYPTDIGLKAIENRVEIRFSSAFNCFRILILHSSSYCAPSLKSENQIVAMRNKHGNSDV
ncbi:MAG: hypothetical protein D6680_07860 [Cyanobacteria bacterium J007]|jgi:hypothetical protein|nr:MAG: hypothetical protein D6680_07860 [Cyanobacteria bacterium J007]